MKKNPKYIKILFLIPLIILLIFPFALEKILYNTTIFPFNIPIQFSRESWFGFIASYLGAIGTFLLGLLAFYQNKRYKDLSDVTEKHLITLQEEIKDLTEKNVELIEINTKISKASYYPILTHLNSNYWNVSIEHLQDNSSSTPTKHQLTVKYEDSNNIEYSVEDIFKRYKTFTHSFKNDGEKTIKNFNCSDLIINNDRHMMGFWMYSSCDILPGEVVYVTYATKSDLHEDIQNEKIESLSFTYVMENVIGDHFKMSVDIHFYNLKETPVDTYIEISPISNY